MSPQDDLAGPLGPQRVTIDPRTRLPYATYLVEGLRRSGVAIRFARLDAPSAPGIFMEVEGRRIWVDPDDAADLDPAALAWADAAATVNLTPATAVQRPDVVLLGPVFGITAWRLPRGYLRWPRLVAAGAPPRASLAGLRFQGLTRRPLDDYRRQPSVPGYVYHRSRRWTDGHESANGPRDRFLAAVERCGIAVDGGLADDRVPLSEYLARTARSSVVFNCPAVHGCLGWKLGEYLALGKAIVSVELGRALPEPLVHGRDVHLVDDDVEAMADAIALLDRDEAYRRHLEEGARSWFERQLTPEVVASKVLTAPTLARRP